MAAICRTNSPSPWHRIQWQRITLAKQFIWSLYSFFSYLTQCRFNFYSFNTKHSKDVVRPGEEVTKTVCSMSSVYYPFIIPVYLILYYFLLEEYWRMLCYFWNTTGSCRTNPTDSEDQLAILHSATSPSSLLCNIMCCIRFNEYRLLLHM